MGCNFKKVNNHCYCFELATLQLTATAMESHPTQISFMDAYVLVILVGLDKAALLKVTINMKESSNNEIYFLS